MMPGMPLPPGALIGRDAVLRRLAQAIGLAPIPLSGPGGLVVLSGDAGIGKSALVARLLADAAQVGWFTGVGHCVGQAGSALAYLPFVELVAAIDLARPDEVEATLAAHPSLGHLLVGRAAARESAAGAGSTDPGQVAEAVHALLTALAADGPALVVIEDVHWADHSSRDLLTLLLTRGFGTALALVVTYRSDDLHRRHPLHETLAVWARIAGAEHVELAPLPDHAVRELVGELESAPIDQRTADEIIRRSEGNPFFTEELVASAAAGQSLTGGLARVLRSRIEQLDETAQRVMHAVALKGGQYLNHDLLSRVVGLSDEVLEAALASAVEHHVLEARWPPAYTFRHALLGETVADGLLPGERLRLHRAYAAVLADQPDLAPASELARHSAAAGDLPTAVRASRAAAEAALAVGGPQDALHHFEAALTWLGDDDPARDEVTLRASAAAMVSGQPIRAVDLLRDRLDHPGRDQRPEHRADLLATLVVRSRSLDLPVDAVALTTEAMSLLGEAVDERRVWVLVARLQALVDTEDFVGASVVASEASLLAERLGLPGAQAEVRTIVARVLEAQNDLDAVESHLRGIVDDLAADDPLRLRAVHQLASIIHRRGDLAGSLVQYDAGAAAAARLRREWAPWGQESRLLAGLTAYELGDWDGAARRLDLGGRPAPQPGRSLFEAAMLIVTAGRGDPLAPHALDALRQWWPVDGLCVVLTVMAGVDALSDAGEVTAALDLAEEAVTVLDRSWGRGEYHAIVRLAAVVAGQSAAAAARADHDLRRRMVALVDDLAGRARDLTASVEQGAAPTRGLADTSRETWAWRTRLEAEVLRLRHAASLGEPPSAAELVAAWRESVSAFERYGHVFETARSRARLAAALQLAGEEVGARQAREAAGAVAARLGARPLLAELAALDERARSGASAFPGASPEAELTPRELEVLGLVARGLTNGQIGKHLFISPKTVSVHVSNVLAKLGASGRTEAAALARERGLLG